MSSSDVRAPSPKAQGLVDPCRVPQAGETTHIYVWIAGRLPAASGQASPPRLAVRHNVGDHSGPLLDPLASAHQTWNDAHMHRRALLPALLGVIAVVAIAQSNPPERFRVMSQQAETRGLAEPYKGVTTGGEPVRGLFPLRSTSLSTEPVRRAAENLLKSLSTEQRARTTFSVDDDEWRKWMNQHFYVRQGVSFEEMSDRTTRGGARSAARVAQREGTQAVARHHETQSHARRAEQ